MQFKGRLKAPGDASEGIVVQLRLDDVFLELNGESQDLGRWRMDDVEAERIQSNEFGLNLAGEPMRFFADDALGFAYDALSVIEDIGSRLRKKRTGFLGIRRGSHESAASKPTESPPAELVADSTSSQPIEVAAGDSRPAFPAAESAPIPSVASTPVASAPLPDPAVEIVGQAATSDEQPVMPDSEDLALPPAHYPGDAPSEHAAQEDVEKKSAPAAAFSFDDADLGTSWAVEVEAIDLGALFAEEIERTSVETGKQVASEDVAQRGEIDPRPQAWADEADAEDDEPHEVNLRAEPSTLGEVAPSNGRLHVSRRGFFGRRSRITDHEHEFTVSRTVGGLTRRVCSVCGHVSFEGEDVYQGWS